ncbi:MAG: type II toxin-antitoxin system PemK/MazF family toxin [Candidatus Yonathbacteria bacterium]|nr:type II toxin-antitoxin system PemK/MazF family toxin [Candidatus Yonathbacteria bacterium]
MPFPFTDLSSHKVRPAVIVSQINKGDDIVLAFISSQKPKKKEPTDVLILQESDGFLETGLKTDSVVRVSKIATLDKKIILGMLGVVNKKTRNPSHPQILPKETSLMSLLQ